MQSGIQSTIGVNNSPVLRSLIVYPSHPTNRGESGNGTSHIMIFNFHEYALTKDFLEGASYKRKALSPIYVK